VWLTVVWSAPWADPWWSFVSLTAPIALSAPRRCPPLDYMDCLLSRDGRTWELTIHEVRLADRETLRFQIMATRRRPFGMKTSKRARTAYPWFACCTYKKNSAYFMEPTVPSAWLKTCHVCLVQKIVSSVPSVPSAWLTTCPVCLVKKLSRLSRHVLGSQISSCYQRNGKA